MKIFCGLSSDWDNSSDRAPMHSASFALDWTPLPVRFSSKLLPTEVLLYYRGIPFFAGTVSVGSSGVFAKLGNLWFVTTVDAVEAASLSDTRFPTPAGYKLNPKKLSCSRRWNRPSAAEAAVIGSVERRG